MFSPRSEAPAASASSSDSGVSMPVAAATTSVKTMSKMKAFLPMAFGRRLSGETASDPGATHANRSVASSQWSASTQWASLARAFLPVSIGGRLSGDKQSEPDTELSVNDLLGSVSTETQGGLWMSHRGVASTRIAIATASDTGIAKIWTVKRDYESAEVTLLAVLGADKDTGSSYGCDESRWRGHQAAVNSLSFPPCGTRVITSSKDCSAKLWGLRGDRLAQFPKSPREADAEEVKLERAMPHLRELRRKYKDRPDTPDIFQTPSKACRELPHEEGVNMASLSEDDGGQEYVLTCSDDATAAIWDADTGRRLRTLGGPDGHRGPVPMATWSPCGTLVLTCSYDHTCIIWGAESGLPLQSFAGNANGMVRTSSKDPHTGPIWSAHLSSDGSAALTASKDWRVKTWDVASGICTSTFAEHTGAVVHAVWDKYTPTLVLSCSLDSTARLHDTRMPGADVVTPFQHRASVWSASFGHEERGSGQLVITASHDMTAAIYDTRKAEAPLHTLLGHAGVLWQASLSEDDGAALTGSDDGTARVWKLRGAGPYPSSTVLAAAGCNRTHDMGVTCAGFVP